MEPFKNEVFSYAAARDTILRLDQIWELNKIIPDWQALSYSITRVFSFNDFQECIYFTNQVSIIASRENNYPSLKIEKKKVIIICGSFSVGLKAKDFVLAQKIDEVFK